jgi:segregation and condensation protein A
LAGRLEANLRTYLRVAPPPKVEAKLDLSDLTLAGLLEAAQTAFSKEKEKQPLSMLITAPRITIREKIDLITKTLRDVERSTFRTLMGEKATRVETVVTFLALLELIKRYHVTAHQEGLFGDIEFEREIEWKEDEEIEIEFE